jgi:hypothetical protein
MNTKVNEQAQAEAMLSIVFAAFQTHYNVTKQAHWPSAEEHWQANKGARTLWTGLVKGIIGNVTDAQNAGLLPAMIAVDLAKPLLPGLGGARMGQHPDTEPAALARRIAAQMPGRGTRPEPEPERGTGAFAREMRGEAQRDTVPGLAVGRETGDDE